MNYRNYPRRKRFHTPQGILVSAKALIHKFETYLIRLCLSFTQFKPIFHCEVGLRWLPNANEMSTNNMKCTWPTRKFCVGDRTQPIFHWLSFGFCVGGKANFIFRIGGNTNLSIFRYQDAGIPNAKLWRWGSKPMPGPNANGFASQ